MASKTEARPLIGLPAILVVMLGVAAAGVFWYLERTPAGGPKGAVLTDEAKAYVRHLELGEVQMGAAENAIHQQVVEITGKITNHGTRHLNSVAITCVFYDPYGQVVLKERVEIVRAKWGGAKPGETKEFRLPFDNLPQSWNQAMPQLVIAGIVFG
ncbi:MAG TPA: FxLYD domain-containing protein [Bryobacteraceae bacterium]|nr:FxLYD domain-containing protein [Bryobacteraceae bacterium]